MTRTTLAALAALAMLTGPAGAQTLFNAIAGQQPAAAEPVRIEPGKKRPLYPAKPERGSSIDIAPGVRIDTDVREAAVFLFAGTAGQSVTIDAESPDIHIMIGAGREFAPVWTSPTFSQNPVAGGPKSARLIFSPKRTGPYYVMIYGFPTKPNGKLEYGGAKEGRIAVSMTDTAHPVAKPIGVGGAAPAAMAAPAAPPPPPVPTVASLAREFAQRCAQVTPANEDACARLRDDLNDAMAGRLRPAVAAPPPSAASAAAADPSGTQTAVEITEIIPGTPMAAAGLKVGDALLYARAPNGQRTLFSDQDSLNAWGATASGTYQLAIMRAGSTRVEMVPITMGTR